MRGEALLYQNGAGRRRLAAPSPTLATPITAAWKDCAPRAPYPSVGPTRGRLAGEQVVALSSVRQISVFLENKCGQLADVLSILSDAGINLGALSIADTAGFGILRFLCNDPDRAAAVLRDGGFSLGETEVVAVWIPHRPGGLAQVTEVLRPLGINIDYLYSFRGPDPSSAAVVLRVENGRDAEATDALRQAGLVLLTAEEASGL